MSLIVKRGRFPRKGAVVASKTIEADMFRLIATVKRGVSSDLDDAIHVYRTLEDAQEAARKLQHFEIVTHIMITSDDVPPRFVQWAVY